VHTARKKNLSTGIRLKQTFLKGVLRLNLQPVQLIFPTSITDKKIHQPSKDIIFVFNYGECAYLYSSRNIVSGYRGYKDKRIQIYPRGSC
jgi:hypothetical protein